ncbi:MAG: S1 RNA-binding domain-containing protein [Clostridiales bacterium]|nr:S1 RNA-binding domain-containing protein [Clostridiales bacterium]MCD7827638.1 S1 RNA-binding domain-containing protein [Clostridiales bacterium]
MQVNIGDIVEGKVTGLTNFGAFVKLPTGEVGMVHISEVASSYVKDIKDFLAEGQEVKVKVLAVNDAGKISLSIKQAEPKPEPRGKDGRGSGGGRRQSGGRRSPSVWQGSRHEEKPQTFEDMMAKFKQNSEDRQSDLKKAEGVKRSGYSRRGNSNKR